MYININKLNSKSLMELANNKKEEYKNAEPFPHIFLDDFFNEDILEKIINEFPDLSSKEDVTHFSNVTNEKFASKRGMKLLGKNTQGLLTYLNSSEFIDFLQIISSINEPLIPDPHFIGGGLHQSKKGGYLKVHADFAWHPETKLDRRVNMLIYLNKNWEESYEGHLQLYDEKMTVCVQKILPIYNRIVIFNTTDYSYHGVPDEINCPEQKTRNSFALYYYSNGRPSNEIRSSLENSSTIYKSRPGETLNYGFKHFIIQFLPPITYPILKSLKNLIKK